MPGRWSLHSFFDDCNHFQKKKEHTHTGFTNDNENNNFWHQKWSVWNTAFFCLFLSLSSPFPFLFFPVSSSSLLSPSPFLFPLLFPFLFPPFSFPFPFLFLSFSFPFPFAFFVLSFSFPFPFPFLFLSLSFPFPSCTIPVPLPFPRSSEFFDQGVKPALGKPIRGKKR